MTREEATEILRDLWCYKHSCRYSDKEIRASIDMAIEALEQAESRWIPCSERLPDTSGSVLIYTEKNGVAEGSYIPQTNKWVQFRWSVINADVIAWIPLPEPYKREE